MGRSMRKSSQRIVAFDTALSEAMNDLHAGQPGAALQRLRRAHVLGQRDVGRHLRVHWLMLRAGWQLRDARETAGQLFRLLLVPLGHVSGRLPQGNPGTADVSAFAPHAVPADVAELLANEDARSR
jgi:hypothetical protein